MQFVCDAPDGKTWFRIETEAEAVLESEAMKHAVEKYFLRDREGNALSTAMLPPGGRDDHNFQMIIVGPGNADPYPANEHAIRALGAHFGLRLDRERCYPYGRRRI